jgi:hypothetical protein
VIYYYRLSTTDQTTGTRLDLHKAPLLTRLLVTEMSTSTAVLEGLEAMEKQLLHRLLGPMPKLLLIDPRSGLILKMAAWLDYTDYMTSPANVTSSEWRQLVTSKLPFAQSVVFKQTR